MFEKQVKNGPVTSTLIKSQTVIIGEEMLLSSDDSSSIDVCMLSPKVKEKYNGLNISVELVDCLSDDENNTSTQIIWQMSSPTAKFVPLDDESRCLAAMKFKLVIKPQSSDLKYLGIGNACKSPPIITIYSHGDGTYLFNIISILMTGRDTYSAIIRHVVCNNITNPVKYGLLKL